MTRPIDRTATEANPIPPERERGNVLARAERPVDSGKNRPREYGGPSGPEPTRYGDWERKGRCTDF